VDHALHQRLLCGRCDAAAAAAAQLLWAAFFKLLLNITAAAAAAAVAVVGRRFRVRPGSSHAHVF
jgi:hypothetical protein